MIAARCDYGGCDAPAVDMVLAGPGDVVTDARPACGRHLRDMCRYPMAPRVVPLARLTVTAVVIPPGDGSYAVTVVERVPGGAERVHMVPVSRGWWEGHYLTPDYVDAFVSTRDADADWCDSAEWCTDPAHV